MLLPIVATWGYTTHMELRVRRLGFVREMASKWHVLRGDEEALVTQPD